MKSFLLILQLFVLGVTSNIISPSVEVFNANKKSFVNVQLEPISSNDECNRQIDFFNRNLAEGNLWAKEMRDSWGDFPSGIYSGNTFDFGSFDQCINIRHNLYEVGEVIGQHCTLMIPYERNPPRMGKLSAVTRS